MTKSCIGHIYLSLTKGGGNLIPDFLIELAELLPSVLKGVKDVCGKAADAPSWRMAAKEAAMKQKVVLTSQCRYEHGAIGSEQGGSLQ